MVYIGGGRFRRGEGTPGRRGRLRLWEGVRALYLLRTTLVKQ